MTPAQRRCLYTLLPPEHLCRVLECSEDACVYLQEMELKTAARMLSDMEADAAVDDSGCFYGAIDLKELILTAENRPLEDVIVTSYPYLYSHEEIEDCVELLKNYSEDSIPVLDNENHILGVITAKDTIQVIDAELSEDYARLAGLSAGEDLAEPVTASMKKRLPWLMVLMLLGILISSVIGVFERVVSQLTTFSRVSPASSAQSAKRG